MTEPDARVYYYKHKNRSITRIDQTGGYQLSDQFEVIIGHRFLVGVNTSQTPALFWLRNYSSNITCAEYHDTFLDLEGTQHITSTDGCFRDVIIVNPPVKIVVFGYEYVLKESA